MIFQIYFWPVDFLYYQEVQMSPWHFTQLFICVTTWEFHYPTCCIISGWIVHIYIESKGQATSVHFGRPYRLGVIVLVGLTISSIFFDIKPYLIVSVSLLVVFQPCRSHYSSVLGFRIYFYNLKGSSFCLNSQFRPMWTTP